MRTIANDKVFGLALSSLAVLFLLFDSAGKLLQVQPVIDGTLRDARLRALLPIRRAS